MFKIIEYWPFPALNTKAIFTYYNPDKSSANVVSNFHLDMNTQSILCEDYVAGKYQDTWYLRYDYIKGVVEWRDDQPLSGALSWIFGSTKKIVYKSGNEILWGVNQNIGDTIENSIVIDFSKSTGALPASGWQVVKFNNHYSTYVDCIGQTWNDVLEFTYTQTWGSKTTGAIYRNAKGIGPIEIQWVGINNNKTIITPPIAAKVKNVSS